MAVDGLAMSCVSTAFQCHVRHIWDGPRRISPVVASVRMRYAWARDGRTFLALHVQHPCRERWDSRGGREEPEADADERSRAALLECRGASAGN